jgi:hypothetical protein
VPHSSSASPHDALINALQRVEEMESVLIIFDSKSEDGPAGSFDSDLTVERALWLVEMFKHWLLSHTIVDRRDT